MDTQNDTETIRVLLQRLQDFANSFEPFTTFEATAQRMLFSRSSTAFRSAVILCYEGLFIDSYNSIRVALEAGWLALILRRSAELSREWLTLVPMDTADTEVEKRYRRTFGNLPWIRETVSRNASELFEKNKYLSDTLY